ncbi:MAG: hypothetical protein LBP26_00340 [Clostridiales bacterium]|jgi:alpha-N-arabinofuranosidase|nr:hypothetical protein [Clostridiales bacterium]
MADALVVAGLLCTLINHSDRVKIACFAQLVNVIAPIFTQNGGGMFKQTIFHPIAAFANNAAGTLSLSTWADIPVYRSQRFGDAPYIRHAVCYDPQNREYLVFAVNAGDAAELLLEFTEATAFTRHIVLKHPNISQKNSFDAPNAVSPVDAVCASGKNKVFSVDLDAKSFSFMRFSAK